MISAKGSRLSRSEHAEAQMIGAAEAVGGAAKGGSDGAHDLGLEGVFALN